jgi:hypothetical protein
MPTNVEKVDNLQSQGNVELFFQTISTNVNIYKNLMSKELIGFCQYPIDVENCKCPLSWWHKEQNKFPTFVIQSRHILSILANQIEIEHIVFIVGILIAL